YPEQYWADGAQPRTDPAAYGRPAPGRTTLADALGSGAAPGCGAGAGPARRTHLGGTPGAARQQGGRACGAEQRPDRTHVADARDPAPGTGRGRGLDDGDHR